MHTAEQHVIRETPPNLFRPRRQLLVSALLTNIESGRTETIVNIHNTVLCCGTRFKTKSHVSSVYDLWKMFFFKAHLISPHPLPPLLSQKAPRILTSERFDYYRRGADVAFNGHHPRMPGARQKSFPLLTTSPRNHRRLQQQQHRHHYHHVPLVDRLLTFDDMCGGGKSIASRRRLSLSLGTRPRSNGGWEAERFERKSSRKRLQTARETVRRRNARKR